MNGLGFTSTSSALEDGSELTLGPTTLSGLRVTRKIWGAAEVPVVRYTEIFENLSGVDVDATVRVVHNLGSDTITQLVATGSGDDTPSLADQLQTQFAANQYSGGGAGTSPISGSPSTTARSRAEIPARRSGSATPTPSRWTCRPPLTGSDQLLRGMSPDHLRATVNGLPFPSYAVVGEAGSVASFTELTGTHRITAAQATTTASSDGSFVLIVRMPTSETPRAGGR
ncbi:MAG: hypothetical protein KTR31_25355 [Myxococcales bacterium]|nr:hypothetical protein [Myxococcales bacterium]